MTFDFHSPVDRHGTASVKWDRYKGRDVLPLWLADMDFRAPPAVIEALHRHVEHGVFGYTLPPDDLVEEVVSMLMKDHGWKVSPEWIVWLPGLVSGLNVACRAVGEEGDDVLTAVPVYPPFLTAPGNAGRRIVPLLAATVLCGLAVVSFRQVGYWRDSSTLFEHALDVNRENWLAHATLGAALLSDSGRWDDAERHLREAIRIRPAYATAHFNLGLVLSDRGRLKDANRAFQKSLELQPPCLESHYFLALNAMRLGDIEAYQRHAQRAESLLGIEMDASPE